MINLLLSLSLLFAQPSPEVETVCSCINKTTTICGNLKRGAVNLLGSVILYDLDSPLGGEYYELKVIDASDAQLIGDTITVGGEGFNTCVDNPLPALPGDTLFMNLIALGYPNIDYAPVGCGFHRLKLENDSLKGLILPGVTRMRYQDFKDNYTTCYQSPYHIQLQGQIETWNKGTPLTDLSLVIDGIPLEQGGYAWPNGQFFYPYIPFTDLQEASDEMLIQASGDIKRGVTTLDLIKIQRHILKKGIPLGTEARIAADVDFSGTITTKDLIHIRQVILGRADAFPNHESWVIYPEDLFLPRDQVLVAGQFNQFRVPKASYNPYLKFKAIKLGDVTGDI